MNKEPDLHEPLLNYPVDVGRMARFGVLHQYVEEQIAGGEPAFAFRPCCPPVWLSGMPADYLGLIEAAV